MYMFKTLFISVILLVFSGCVSLGPIKVFAPKHVVYITPSESPDVKGYRLYVEKKPNEVTFESQHFSLGKEELVVDLWDLGLEEGSYTIGVTTLDGGYEGALIKCKDVAKIKTKKGD